MAFSAQGLLCVITDNESSSFAFYQINIKAINYVFGIKTDETSKRYMLVSH
jgi:hypothetical protein